MERAALVGLSDVTYELLDKLGEGGFGSVWLARKNPLRRLVALKLLEHQVSDADERRLWNEALVLASLHHPSIVAAEDLVRLDGRLGLVTEYVEGEDLSACIVDGLPSSALLEAVAQVAWALHAAAQRGVVHRDVKPQNIRIGRHGNVKLLDFGIAFADGGGSDASLIVGTPRYMAPERFALEAGPGSDVFSLGCILWLGLTGEHFFGEARAFTEVASLARSDVGWDELVAGWPTTGLAELDDLARSMVARRVEDRPSAADVAARCEALVDRFADRVRLGEWCRVRWPDGVSVPLPPVAERTASSLAGEEASPDEEATEATERAAPMPRTPVAQVASLADLAPTAIAPRSALGPSKVAPPVEPPRVAPARGALRLAAAVVAVSALLGFAVVVGGGVVGAALYTAAPATMSSTAPPATAPGSHAAPGLAAIPPAASELGPAAATSAPAPAPATPIPIPTAVPTGDPTAIPAAPERALAGPRQAPAAARPAPAPSGLRSPAAVRTMIGRRLDELVPAAVQRCGSGANGRWLLTFTVQPAGGTGDVGISALERPSSAVEACVVEQVRGWRFDAVATAQPVSRTLRFP